MIEQLMSSELAAKITAKLDLLRQTADVYLTGTANLKTVSLLLMMLATGLFVLLIIIICIRNIVYFVKEGNQTETAEDISDEEAESQSAEDGEQQELERELQRELEMALAEQRTAEREQQEKFLRDERKKEKNSKTEKQEEKKEEIRRKEPKVDFDWQKGKIPPAELANISDINEISLSYKQSRKELSQLMGLIIDMLGRGVDELKIAQTLNFKTQGMTDENEILKAIDAVKQFINLSLSGKFAKLKQYDSLPKEDQALYNLAGGDTSLVLQLLENLMDSSIDKANSGLSEEKRQKIYNEVSGYACCFGVLAEMNDIMLATSSYELAIELQSANVTAWSRLGDVYKKANSVSKAVWAYQNTINFADGEIDADAVANANKNLSEHLYAEGNSLQAAKLYNSSKQYYDSLGINRRLDKQEIEIIQVIEENQQASLPEMIQKLLGATNFKS